MKQAIVMGLLTALFMTVLTACGNSAESTHSQEVQDMTSNTMDAEYEEEQTDNIVVSDPFTIDSVISDVMNDPVFGDYGRLIFPVDDWYYSGNTLGELHLTYYSNIDPKATVKIVNYMKEHAALGDTIFYDIYTDEEKAADQEKEDTGLFFFKGNPGERFAVCNAGGAFAYVAAMHDSFPHALELSKQGYNAFALTYRPGAQTACEDLARAIQFIFEHAEELARAGLEALADFIKEIGLPTTLRELGVNEATDLKAIADSCNLAPGSYRKMTHEEILKIFQECY